MQQKQCSMPASNQYCLWDLLHLNRLQKVSFYFDASKEILSLYGQSLKGITVCDYKYLLNDAM